MAQRDKRHGVGGDGRKFCLFQLERRVREHFDIAMFLHSSPSLTCCIRWYQPLASAAQHDFVDTFLWHKKVVVHI